MTFGCQFVDRLSDYKHLKNDRAPCASFAFSGCQVNRLQIDVKRLHTVSRRTVCSEMECVIWFKELSECCNIN